MLLIAAIAAGDSNRSSPPIRCGVGDVDRVLVCQDGLNGRVLDELIAYGPAPEKIERVTFSISHANTGAAGMVFETLASELESETELDVGVFGSDEVEDFLAESAYSLDDSEKTEATIGAAHFQVLDRVTSFGRTLELTVTPA